ncbi:MAG: hypothetical protein U0165_13185 [Polyangiaceae bacterium]
MLAGLLRTKTVRRVLGVTCGVSLLATGLIGFAHTPAGRSWLKYLPGASVACPVPAEIRNLTAEQRDANHRRAVQALKGDSPARSRPGLMLSLGASRDELSAWSARVHAQCADQASGLEVRCTGLDDVERAGAAVRTDAVVFRFDRDGHLVSILSMQSTSSPDAAALHVRESSDSLASEAGPSTQRFGDADPEFLAAGALRQARAEFKFSDYHASVAATNMGRDRYVISEVRELIQ